MCGISGIVGLGLAETTIKAMVTVQSHRGPDANDWYVNPAATVALGHNRLSIIDLSDAGRQPMVDHTGQRFLVFNGEIYNYIELKAILTDYPYKTQTDSEVIFAAYEKWGEACVEHFNGMFAFALWDESQQTLFCARDRLGIKPFHYTIADGNFYFASEIKAILAAGIPAEPNWDTWSMYLTHGYYDHSDATFFANIASLTPGHTLCLQHGQIKIRSYWDLPAAAAEPLTLNDDAAAAELKRLLRSAVTLRLRSDVPLGINLSGGLDSASMMMTADALLADSGEIQTFTASFADPRYDEYDFADAVPRLTNWVRNRQRLGLESVWEMLQSALWHQEAPFGGIATLAYHNLHALAKARGVTVLLEGQGVDEMLAGYNYFRPPHYLDLLEQGRWQQMRQEIRLSGLNGFMGTKGVRRLQRGQSLNVYQDGTSHLRPQCVNHDIRSKAPAVPNWATPFESHLNNTLYRDLKHTKLPRVLRMNDRLSMAFSRELREPYLDHRIVEFLFRLPGHQKIRDGQSKFLLRQAMKHQLPDNIRSGQKRAVVTPQREWLREALRPNIEAILTSKRFAERGLFEQKHVLAEYQKFCADEGNNAFFVWQWVNTELWFRRFVDEAT